MFLITNTLQQNVGIVQKSLFVKLVNSLIFHWSLFTTTSEFTVRTWTPFVVVILINQPINVVKPVID